ncbi:MAG: hypothetical protein IPN93_12825 [Bacteroidetes bacterium]|nr:hypothetical protein [Bacteroidota bacterium]MBL0079140.1 hypothetical protein [Bacteroidota bacterium]MBL0287877.1 hypothetical protein [Bacteroidota bacterium]
MITSTVVLRDKLHQFIDSVDEKKVQAMYVMFEEEIETKTNSNFNLSAKEIEALDIQRENYLASKSKTYNWDEVKAELMASIKK